MFLNGLGVNYGARLMDLAVTSFGSSVTSLYNSVWVAYLDI